MLRSIPRLFDRPWFRRRLFNVRPEGRPGDVYLRRWTLVRTGWGKLCLHQFLRPDSDACLHDHPAAFLTLVLAGGYREVLPGGVRWRPPGTLLYRPATFRHRVDVDRPSWSLVWFRRRERAWGFWTPAGWRAWYPGMVPVCEE